MTRKALKIAALIAVIVVAALGAGVVMAGTQSKGQLPEYLGSQTCIGCHSDKFLAWEGSAHSVSMVQVMSAADLPADPSTAPADLKAELDKADFMWHDRRFLAQDSATGELKYLNVSWDATKNEYVAYKGGGVWSQSCGGCHSGAVNQGVVATGVEAGIGCESCHGPGRDHVLGRGDRSKISASAASSETCAQCHSGYNQVADSTRWAKGYRPGMKIEEFAGFAFKEYTPGQAPRFLDDDNHLEQYPQWKASGHANATNLLIARGPTYLARQECIYCHSTSAGSQIADGVKFDPATDLVNDGVSCAACHDPHGSTNQASLKMEPQALCLSCHSVARGGTPVAQIGTTRAPHSPQGDMLEGNLAIGVAPTKGAHSGLKCVDCHMSEGNHMMQVIKPSDAMATEKRVDSCTACHTNSSAESRDVYLTMWDESISTKLAKLKADVALIDAALAKNPTALADDVKAEYINARANFWYVEKDNSGGAHNFEYATKILKSADQAMTRVKAALPQ
ncbi:MAG TPA: ammonia-forming cytochrome c nitrite reductase subunit c552 [Symbiobacteriaceae bacterium]|nr:ammonia-forming cytochrome c nitrite reductase subunit c552 [Symbiobacteriaceae bacterium]